MLGAQYDHDSHVCFDDSGREGVSSRMEVRLPTNCSGVSPGDQHRIGCQVYTGK